MIDYQMTMRRPASWWNGNWREGTPLGNGLHGALIYGNIANEKIMLTHTRLWREGKNMSIPDVSDILPQMRALIFSGEVLKADRMINDALIHRGYAPHEAYPFPAADLNISLPAVKGFSKYKRTLDISTAQAFVEYQDGDDVIQRRSFVSRADDVVVVECHKNSVIHLSIHQPDLINQSEQLPENECIITEGEWQFFKTEISGIEHGAVLKVLRGEKTLILLKIYTEGESSNKWYELKAEIEKLSPDYDHLLYSHIEAHQKLFNACQLSLEDDKCNRASSNEELLDAAYDTGLTNVLAERMWAYGRYLLISSTQLGGLPCNLTGLWSGEYRAFWSFNMANINLEMIYWQALSGGLEELMLPIFDYYDAGLEDMKENARKLYGCEGIFLPAVTMPGGIRHVCLSPHITNWTAGAGWIAQLYYDYYIYTRDMDFLVNRALPFMREAAKFYADFIIWKGEHWHVCPSVSPENHTKNYKGNSKNLGDSNANNDLSDGTQSSIDATMDISVIKELFRHLIEIGGATELLPEDELADYRKILYGTPDYETNEWGAPREWLHKDFPDNDLHRHQSHLYPVFPGLELSRADSRTIEIYHKGAIRRMTVGLSWQTSWSLIQNAHTMARVKDGELAWESLSLITKSCVMRNLFTTHNDWRGSGIGLEFPMAPFQIDANIGWASAVQEMLLYSNTDRVDLLPALPKAWTKGSIGTMKTRCGVDVHITWDQSQNIGNALLCAIRETAFTLYYPDGNYEEFDQMAGENAQVEFRIK